MTYKIYTDRVKLFDSYLVSKRDFGYELAKILDAHPDCPVWKRSEKDLMREWAAHNLSYDLGIRRSMVKDADLEFRPTWWASIVYAVVGTIALWIIK